ncbi:hypothetical protein [Maliponia aquimaris]|uniref:Uncharacterized protein n=1 Tax=Maliponia aquimaris TaxID=1673631 RepID=A0A238K222_9RHOB|nr:hypothetical protein [Maliponia aquimaris]SMX36961.1 hypothetical protein MAA8898_01133 [Maliponia aquimaris]
MPFKPLLALTTATLLASAGAALADHGNPWATAEDTVLSRNHDANQAKSQGTRGEDEMRGVMTRSAHGKLGSTPSGQGGGKPSGNGGGKGGKGKNR